ncbi:MAG: DNA polymerase III, subunit gamma and tau [Candidatus Coatesbacteria bacterium RBG_13_66_14]|uniref:DNA polymerase III subunit gamma/tau n=1 Tax=Candidatus Coatesbacteria bacterium RBG_13_66_14 TaxID=1817816 RepID=A0A1F5F6H7_9BACT|nr:MAG: DNA polymerase III, subunit gamma and tau [Candidatus Coatesbacteria bacterium RBG_13_66_14]
MSYQVIARKWRPQVFSEVIGQQHICRMLQNAVSQGRVGHAYLFAGPRGVGKTTTARLLAKALNCVTGPTPEPCNSCDQCRSIASGANVDVIEIDAASNRGIDEIRALRENVKFAPAGGRYKIYIIDEVHMLTREAFNALLKTLEEPPEHAVFILATTDPDKLPPTITSRCQRLTFRRIPTGEIAALLERIALEEGYELDHEAALLAARSASGAIRDAESTLEQLFAYGEKRITLQEARAVLGKVGVDTLVELTGAVLEGDAANVVRRVTETVDSGIDPRVLAEELLDLWRDRFIHSLGGEAEGLVERLAERAPAASEHDVPPETWLSLLAPLRRAMVELKLSRQPRLTLELALVELSRLPRLISLTELAERLRGVEGENPPAAQKKTRTQTDDGINGKPGEREDGTWEEFLPHLRKSNTSVGAFAAEAREVRLEDDRLILVFPPEFSFHHQQLRKMENVRVVEQAATEFYSRPVTFEALLESPPESSEGKAEETVKEHPAAGVDLDGLSSRDRQAIQRTTEVFDARVVRIDGERRGET